MPSVKVKRDYAQLSDYPGSPNPSTGTQRRSRALSAAETFTRPLTGSARLRTHSQEVVERDGGVRPLTADDQGRPAYLRTASKSRVSTHIASTTTRPSNFRRDSLGPLPSRDYRQYRDEPAESSSRRRPSVTHQQQVPEGEVLSFDGPQASVTIPADGEMGRVESALSGHGSDAYDDEDEDEFDDDHHPDDVVEHLDVIGERSTRGGVNDIKIH